MGATPEPHKTGLHASLGRAEGRQPGLGVWQQREILGELALQETGGVFTFHTNHAEVGQGGDAIESGGHA